MSINVLYQIGAKLLTTDNQLNYVIIIYSIQYFINNLYQGGLRGVRVTMLKSTLFKHYFSYIVAVSFIQSKLKNKYNKIEWYNLMCIICDWGSLFSFTPKYFN